MTPCHPARVGNPTVGGLLCLLAVIVLMYPPVMIGRAILAAWRALRGV